MEDTNSIEQPIEKKIDDTLTPVQPSAQIISFVEIECRVLLHKGMFCLVHTYNQNREKIKIFQVELSPQEYNDWVDDVAMEALILSKCGLLRN